jgi:hypothetical protein
LHPTWEVAVFTRHEMLPSDGVRNVAQISGISKSTRFLTCTLLGQSQVKRGNLPREKNRRDARKLTPWRHETLTEATGTSRQEYRSLSQRECQ